MNRTSLRAAVVAGALIFPTQPAWAQAAAQTAVSTANRPNVL